MRLVALLATSAALLFAAPAQGAADVLMAQAQSDPGVGELWEEFPLEDEGTPEPRESPGAGQGGAAAATPTSTATPSPTPTASAAKERPDAQAAAPASGDDEGGSSSAVWIVLAILAVIVVDVLIFLRVRNARRRRSREASDPVWGQSSNIYAIGATDRDGIGAFRGFVHSLKGPGFEPGSDQMLYVRDPSRDEPIWVRRSEVESLSSGGPPRRLNGARAGASAGVNGSDIPTRSLEAGRVTDGVARG